MGRAAGFLALALLGVTPAVTWPGEFATAMQTFEHVHALAFDATGHALWPGAHTGLYRTEDGGRTWAKIQVHGHGLDVLAIAAHPAEATCSTSARTKQEL